MYVIFVYFHLVGNADLFYIPRQGPVLGNAFHRTIYG